MTLLILGASARAAAQSALRAGLEPIAIDLFADLDLRAACGEGRATAIPNADYPDGFEALTQNLPPGPWMFTGAIENRPDLVDRIAAVRPLWGIAGKAVRDIRDPLALAEILAGRGLAVAPVRDDPAGLARDGSWLEKPRASAGGRSIRPLIEPAEPPARPSYYQLRIDGLGLSAVYVGRDGGAILIGVSRQLLGRAGEPFAYAGSIGPWPISDPLQAEIGAIGDALTRAFGLRGVFGVDLIVRPDGRPVAVEVNPRYTASVEVLELASGRSVLAEHRRAFEPDAPMHARTRRNPPGFVGKAILFADHSSTIDDRPSRRIRPRALSTFAVPALADVPAATSEFDAGDPVLTVLARGRTIAECEAKLARRLASWRGRLRERPLVPHRPGA